MPIQKRRSSSTARRLSMSLFLTRSRIWLRDAALTHISGKELAKTVIVKIDGALIQGLP